MPVKIASTFGEVSFTIVANAPPAATSSSSVAPSGVPSLRALVVLGDQHVGLAVGRVAVGQLRGDAVDRVDRVTEVELRDAAGRDQRRRLLVTAPMTPTVHAVRRRSASYSGSAGFVVPLR